MKLFLILLLPNIVFALNNFINTQSVIVIGSIVYYKNSPVIQFLGIPYAQPPVGDLRFKKTVPVKYNRSPIMADTYPPACVQYYPFEYPWVDNDPGHSEDCLYLNIWTPADSSPQNPKAVMFWLFGGGFTDGSNRKPVYDGHVLAAQGDVIVVTINYRLGVFGFLSTGTEDAPGNMGLFDALEALKWVNNNIHAFGGDKSRITVFGQRAGSIMGGYFCLSPLTRGLFQQVIMQSESPLNMFGDVFESNFKLGQKLAEAVGCATNFSSIKTNPHEVVECLKGKDAMELTFIVNFFNPTLFKSFLPIYGDEFLPTNPRDDIIRGNLQNIKLLIGNVKDEGSIGLPSLKPEVFGAFGERNTRINKSYGEDLILESFKNFDFRHDVVDHYVSNLQANDYDAIRSQVYHSFGDFTKFCPNLYFAESMSKKENSVYFYYFSHRPSITPWAKWMGVPFFSEVPFVFGRPLDNFSNYGEAEKNLSETLITLWTNFAKFGVPSWDWQRFSTPDYYIKRLEISTIDDDYLRSHLYNCDFFRKYFGF